MSYLTLPNGITGFTKATISLWFRIPQELFDAAAAEFEAAYNNGDPDATYTYGQGWRAGEAGGAKGAVSRAGPPALPMAGIIPLVIFGQPGTDSDKRDIEQNFGSSTTSNYFWQYTTYPAGVWVLQDSATQDIIEKVTEPGFNTWATEPSYIGVWCTGNPQRALLAISLETGARASFSGGLQSVVGKSVSDRQFYNGPVDEMPLRTFEIVTTYGADSSVFWARTESFRTHPWPEDIAQYDGTLNISPPFGITVTPDHWHHLLLSFDLTIPCLTHGISTNDTDVIAAVTNSGSPSEWTTSAPKIWIAYDDENKEGRDLSYYWIGKGASGTVLNPPEQDKPDNTGADPNAILSPHGWMFAGMYNGADYSQDTPASPSSNNEEIINTVAGALPASYSFIPPPLPTADAQMGFPAPADYVDHVRHVEMAEFQLFTDLAVDTADETTRRAFIDQNGKPVKSTQKFQSFQEGDSIPAGSEQLLGKPPEILLHGSGHWKKGFNTGSTGVATVGSSGQNIPAAQFTPTGFIKAYKPDPSLYGPQDPPGTLSFSPSRRLETSVQLNKGRRQIVRA